MRSSLPQATKEVTGARIGRPHSPVPELPFADQVVSVAAHDSSGLCHWSNKGPWVDLAAPGSDIVSTYVTHADFPTGFARWSGTSFAAPFVAAAHSKTGTIAGAVDEVRKRALERSYDGYPGLA